MTERQNIRMIEELYAAFGRADLPFILDMVAEDVDWQHPRPADIPWGGKRRGREEVAQFFAAIGEQPSSPSSILARIESPGLISYFENHASTPCALKSAANFSTNG